MFFIHASNDFQQRAHPIRNTHAIHALVKTNQHSTETFKTVKQEIASNDTEEKI